VRLVWKLGLAPWLKNVVAVAVVAASALHAVTEPLSRLECYAVCVQK
jgi:hypothetical protein